MKIFFTSPYEGKKLYQKYIDQIIEIVESTGAQVISPEKTRQYQDAFRKENLIKLGDKDRVHYEFIRQGIANSDAVIIESTYEDFRVGHEATLALIYKKPVLVLSIHKNYGEYIIHEGFTGAKYNSGNVDKIVKNFLTLVSKKILSQRKKNLTLTNVKSKDKKLFQRNVVVLGSINIDLVTQVSKIPRENEVVISEGLKLLPGGKATNTGIGISRLGGQTYMVGKVGNDVFGEDVKEIFNREEINSDFVDIDSFIPTGTVMVNVDAKGKNTIIVNEDANIRISKKTIFDLMSKVDEKKLEIDCFYLTLEPLPEIVEYAVSECYKRGIPVFCDAAPQARPLNPKLYPYINFLSANEYEASGMAGIKVIDVKTAMEASLLLREKGAKNVIITLGYMGAVLLAEGKDKAIYYPGNKVKVVDETAAGDAFRAAFVVEYLATANLKRSMEFANLAGAYAVTKLGAYEAMPTREGLQFLKLFN